MTSKTHSYDVWRVYTADTLGYREFRAAAEARAFFMRCKAGATLIRRKISDTTVEVKAA